MSDSVLQSENMIGKCNAPLASQVVLGPHLIFKLQMSIRPNACGY